MAACVGLLFAALRVTDRKESGLVMGGASLETQRPDFVRISIFAYTEDLEGGEADRA